MNHRLVFCWVTASAGALLLSGCSELHDAPPSARSASSSNPSSASAASSSISLAGLPPSTTDATAPLVTSASTAPVDSRPEPEVQKAFVTWLLDQEKKPQLGTTGAKCRDDGWCVGRCNDLTLPGQWTCEIRYFSGDPDHAAVAIEMPGQVDCNFQMLSAPHPALAPRQGRDMEACPHLSAPLSKFQGSRQLTASSTEFGQISTFFVLSTPGYKAGLTGREYR